MADIMEGMKVDGKKLFKLKRDKKKAEDGLTAINKQIGELETGLAERMNNAEVEKFTIKGAGTISVRDELNVYVLAENRPQVFDWLKKHGHGEIVKDWVFPQTMKAWVKEQRGENKPVPDLIKVSVVPVAATRSDSKAKD